MYLPEVIILSTQRSGTHLLDSILRKHPMIHGKGEMFLRYRRKGTLLNNVEDKINIGILMYSELSIFLKLGGGAYKPLIIHLLRNPYDVALSRLQMRADRLKLGNSYKAHCKINELEKPEVSKRLKDRIEPDDSSIDSLVCSIAENQQKHVLMLKNIPHLQINYEEIALDNESVTVLNKEVQKKLMIFLNLSDDDFKLSTSYYKTGIVGY